MNKKLLISETEKNKILSLYGILIEEPIFFDGFIKKDTELNRINDIPVTSPTTFLNKVIQIKPEIDKIKTKVLDQLIKISNFSDTELKDFINNNLKTIKLNEQYQVDQKTYFLGTLIALIFAIKIQKKNNDKREQISGISFVGNINPYKDINNYKNTVEGKRSSTGYYFEFNSIPLTKKYNNIKRIIKNYEDKLIKTSDGKHYFKGVNIVNIKPDFTLVNEKKFKNYKIYFKTNVFNENAVKETVLKKYICIITINEMFQEEQSIIFKLERYAYDPNIVYTSPGGYVGVGGYHNYKETTDSFSLTNQETVNTICNEIKSILPYFNEIDDSLFKLYKVTEVKTI